jgi:hypothetical protein
VLRRQDELVRHVANVTLGWAANIALLGYFLIGWAETLGVIVQAPLVAVIGIWYIALFAVGF